MDITKSRDGGTGKLIYHANFNTGKFNILNPDAPTDASRYETFDAEPVASKNGEIQF
jgi:hypothetical protein